MPDDQIDQIAAPIWRAAGLEPPRYADVGQLTRDGDPGDESIEEIWARLNPGEPFPGETETTPPTDAAVDSFARGIGLDEKGKAR